MVRRRVGATAWTGTGGPRRRSINEILFSRRRWLRRRPFNFRRWRHFIFFRLRTGRRAATRRRHSRTFFATRCTSPALPWPRSAQPLHSLHRRRRRPERFGAASAREKMQIRREFYRRGPTPTPPLPLAIGTRRRQQRQTGRRRAVRARGPCSARRQRKAQLNSATTRSTTPIVYIYIYMYAEPM